MFPYRKDNFMKFQGAPICLIPNTSKYYTAQFRGGVGGGGGVTQKKTLSQSDLLVYWVLNFFIFGPENIWLLSLADWRKIPH